MGMSAHGFVYIGFDFPEDSFSEIELKNEYGEDIESCCDFLHHHYEDLTDLKLDYGSIGYCDYALSYVYYSPSHENAYYEACSFDPKKMIEMMPEAKKQLLKFVEKTGIDKLSWWSEDLVGYRFGCYYG